MWWPPPAGGVGIWAQTLRNVWPGVLLCCGTQVGHLYGRLVGGVPAGRDGPCWGRVWGDQQAVVLALHLSQARATEMPRRSVGLRCS